MLGRRERDSIEGNFFVLCRTFFSAINSFDSTPQFGKICLLVHSLNTISQFWPFMYVDAFLDVFISLDSLGEAGSLLRRSSRLVITSSISADKCYFLVESVASSMDVVRCYFE